MDLMLRRRMLMALAVVQKILHTIASATGLVTFSTQLAEPLESCVCEFAPVQAGTGDPSPTNIRPITGWTGVTVGHASVAHKCIPVSGTHWESNGVSCDYIGIGTYWIHGTASAATYFRISINSLTIPSGTGRLFEMHNSPADSNVTMVILNNSTTIDSWLMSPADRVSSGYNAMAGKTMNVFGINLSSGKTYDFTISPTFSKDKQTDIPISWQSTAGTVYGGTLDVVSGVLTVTWATKTLNGTETKYEAGSYNRWTITLFSASTMYYVRTSSAYLKCDRFIPIAASSSGGSPVAAYIQGQTKLGLQNVPGLPSTADELKAWLAENPVQIVYRLYQNQTYQLTPTEVSALIGSNTVWHDGNGSISVDYYDKT